MKKYLYSLESITNYKKLGTGRQRRRVVAVNEEGRLLFIAPVLHNCNPRGEIVFDDPRTFDPRTQTMYTKFSRTFNAAKKTTSTVMSDRRKVSLKLCSDIWE